MALLTTGMTKGLVVDCGHLETNILPLYDMRPLLPYVTTTPLAGRSLGLRLRALLLGHGRYIPPSTLHLSLAPQNPVPVALLTPDLLEDMKTRVLFCSPVKMPHEEEDRLVEYKNLSIATDLYYPIALPDGGKANLWIPGWVRERAAEVLFEGDEDEPSVVYTILDCLLKLQPDLRKHMVGSLLIIGGTSLLPGFHARLKQELLQIMKAPTESERKRYSSLLQLWESVKFIESPEESGRVFMNNVRGWIGGSLMGSLKLSGEEMSREKFAGQVMDWSIGNWNSEAET
ncbi:hypothetical protein F4703DRAFT_1858354 [Phycomyces blakesleeanus]